LRYPCKKQSNPSETKVYLFPRFLLEKQKNPRYSVLEDGDSRGIEIHMDSNINSKKKSNPKIYKR
jgi:hypothetical protein